MGLSARAQFTPRNGLGQFVEAVVTPAVVASVTAGCKLIQEAAQGYCPVDTGALRDSITVDVKETGTTVVGTVGPHTDYASYVEYGTGRKGTPAPYAHTDKPGMVAQPYMRPALDENRDPILDLFKGQLAQAFKG